MASNFFEPGINYYVDDVEKIAQFYIDNFGFVETFRTPKGGELDKVEIRLGSFVLGLAKREAGKSMHGLDIGPADNPRAEVMLWTDDVDEAYDTLIKAGVPMLIAPHSFLEMLRAAWVLDPEGNPVQIVSRLNQK
ncbi:MAG: VOC family protein [Chloroflexota bacterium]